MDKFETGIGVLSFVTRFTVLDEFLCLSLALEMSVLSFYDSHKRIKLSGRTGRNDNSYELSKEITMSLVTTFVFSQFTNQCSTIRTCKKVFLRTTFNGQYELFNAYITLE